MTTPDAGQAKPSSQNTRLIEDLREWQLLSQAKLRDRIEQAADEIERLRGVEADARRYRYVRDAGQRDYGVLCEQRSNVYLKFGQQLDNAIDAAIAASRSTGAADVGEDHG